MWDWYSRAAVCYAFLEDVDDLQNPRSPNSRFRNSRWFKRGWTLQELIAPKEVFFLSRGWRVLGTKNSLAAVIEEITGIDRDVLTHKRSLDSISVARRMSWAANRQTTRTEDEAYSLMGLFGVHLPTIYGEGRKAFLRLQREILEHCPDQSIFAWGHIFPDHTMIHGCFEPLPVPHHIDMVPHPWSEEPCLLASSPAAFAGAHDIVPIPLESFAQRIYLQLAPPHYTVTSHGIHVHFPVLIDNRANTCILAALACQDASGHVVALMLQPVRDTNQHIIGKRSRLLERDPSPPPAYDHSSQVYLEEGQVDDKDAYYLHPEGTYYRCTTIQLDALPLFRSVYPNAPPTPSTRHAATFVLRDFYLPTYYRSAVSLQIPTTVPPSPGSLLSRSFSFSGPCEIVFPQWLPSQLHDSGYTLCLPRPHNRIPTSPIVLDWETTWYRVIALTDKDGHGAADIHLLLCPHEVSDAHPVHATVLFRDNSPSAFHWSGFRQAPSCDIEHIDCWPNASRTFVDPAPASGSGTGMSVGLTFGRTSFVEAGEAATYSLLIDVVAANSGEESTAQSSVARRSVLMEREWDSKRMDRWDDELGDTSSDSDEEEQGSDGVGAADMIEEHPVNFVAVKFIPR